MSDYSWGGGGAKEKDEKQIWKTMINMPNGDVLDASLLVNIIKKDIDFVYNENTGEMEEKIEIMIVQNAPIKFLYYKFHSSEDRETFLEELKEMLINKGIEILF